MSSRTGYPPVPADLLEGRCATNKKTAAVVLIVALGCWRFA
jgi:hypothetical protein